MSIARLYVVIAPLLASRSVFITATWSKGGFVSERLTDGYLGNILSAVTVARLRKLQVSTEHARHGGADVMAGK